MTPRQTRAADPSTDPALLGRWASSALSSRRLRRAVASNPSTPGEGLERLLEKALAWQSSGPCRWVLANPSPVAGGAFLGAYEKSRQRDAQGTLLAAVRRATTMSAGAASVLVTTRDHRLGEALAGSRATPPEVLLAMSRSRHASRTAMRLLGENPGLPADALLGFFRSDLTASAVVRVLGERAEEFLLGDASTLGEFLGRSPGRARRPGALPAQDARTRRLRDGAEAVARLVGELRGHEDVGRAARRAQELIASKITALEGLEDALAAVTDRQARRTLTQSVARAAREVEDGLAEHERLVAALSELRGEEVRAVGLGDAIEAVEARTRAARELNDAASSWVAATDAPARPARPVERPLA